MKSDKFWEKVTLGAESECWQWTGARFHFGHGVVYVVGRKSPDRAHRVAWTLTHGPIPEKMCVLHRCDNPPCCNPAHLFLGTKSDNSKDRDTKGRQASGARSGRYTKPESNVIGARNGRALLTEIAVKNIRLLRNDFGATLLSLAKQFGVSTSVIHRVASRQSWRHVS